MQDIVYFCFSDGIANAKMVRPDHLDDLLSMPSNKQKGQGARPKSKQKPKNTKPPTKDLLKGCGESEVSKKHDMKR